MEDRGGCAPGKQSCAGRLPTYWKVS